MEVSAYYTCPSAPARGLADAVSSSIPPGPGPTRANQNSGLTRNYRRPFFTYCQRISLLLSYHSLVKTQVLQSFKRSESFYCRRSDSPVRAPCAIPIMSEIVALGMLAGRNSESQSDWCDSVVDWSSDVDQRRIFVCPTLTPLYYAEIYRELTAAQQLRYNQLSALSFNDLILFFERSFAGALGSLLRQRERRTAESRCELESFLADQRRHCELWRRLTSASVPRQHHVDDYRIIRVGRPLRVLLGMLTKRPRTFPVVVLMMLTLEEHSLEMSRRCARVASNVLEPHYRDAFRAHLLDEVRHVQIDSKILHELIDPLSGPIRRLNAGLFQLFLRKLWLRPARAAARVVKVLADELQELRPIQSRLLAGLVEAGNNPEYRRMMLSARCAPLLFRLLRAISGILSRRNEKRASNARRRPTDMIRDSPTGRFAIPTRANVAIIVFQLAALATCFYAAAHIHRWWSIGLLAIGFGILMNSIYSVIHEAEHAMLFPSRPWNDLAGVVMALFFPAPFHLIRQGHLGHHLRNRSDDEAFDLYFEDDHSIWRRLVLYGILTGCYWIVVVLSNVVFLLRHSRSTRSTGNSIGPRRRLWSRLTPATDG